ncbi:MAG TPA: hypothetical protein VGD77_00655 [Gemmatimonadaceae bacterium]
MEGERRHRRPAGLHGRAERLLDAGLTTLVVALTAGWVWAIAFAPASAATILGDRGSLARTVTAALTEPGAPSAAFITDAALDAMTGGWRGASGRLRARFVPAGSPVPLPVDSGHVVLTRPGGAAGDTIPVPTQAGIFSVALAIGEGVRSVANFSVISLRPFSDKRNGRIGGYMIGSWPGERGAKLRERYGNPSGFIEVTPQNADTPVSEHFTLRDFLTKGQANTWPKYLVLETRLVDKLELVLAELEKEGIDTRGVVVMSGFRTPSYNAGGGNTAGRANLSRHMYGDASDIYIDNDHNGTMDDLNHDGKLDIRDSRVIEAAAERVERAHPELVGGVGVYPSCCGHGPFIHIDTRGYRARWVGTSGG